MFFVWVSFFLLTTSKNHRGEAATHDRTNPWAGQTSPFSFFRRKMIRRTMRSIAGKKAAQATLVGVFYYMLSGGWKAITGETKTDRDCARGNYVQLRASGVGPKALELSGCSPSAARPSSKCRGRLLALRPYFTVGLPLSCAIINPKSRLKLVKRSLPPSPKGLSTKKSVP
jgi:hypothetical protein